MFRRLQHKQLQTQQELLHQLREEIRQLDSTIIVEEARLGDYKRQTTKDWMALKFGGLSELAEKAMVRSPPRLAKERCCV